MIPRRCKLFFTGALEVPPLVELLALPVAPIDVTDELIAPFTVTPQIAGMVPGGTDDPSVPPPTHGERQHVIWSRSGGMRQPRGPMPINARLRAARQMHQLFRNRWPLDVVPLSRRK